MGVVAREAVAHFVADGFAFKSSARVKKLLHRGGMGLGQGARFGPGRLTVAGGISGNIEYILCGKCLAG